MKHDQNLLIHSLLLQLEQRMLDERFGGKLPETIFIQIDGGPENATKTLLAVCALIVHKQLGGCKQIILT